MPIPRSPNGFDFLDEFKRHDDRIRRLELQTNATEQVESFIMDPITVRAWPAACADYMRITGVLLFIGTGTATVDFKAVVHDTVAMTTTVVTLHTFTTASSGAVHSALDASMDYGDVLDLDIGDFYYPEITAGSGNNISAGFITSVGH
jgi:hypothetical protein